MDKFDLNAIDRFNQIGVAVRDVDATARFLDETFGIKIAVFIAPEAKAILRGREVTFTAKIGIGKVGAMDLECVEILQGEHIIQEFIDRQGPGLHHMGIYVHDLDAALAVWEARGRRLVQKTIHPSGFGTFYLDTEAQLGSFYIELMKKI
jgi:methylmalonyl-CoA/ethylmalonyl-CoA epimerase